MLPNRTAIAFCALTLSALALPSAAQATLITYFNFNGYDGNSSTINADSGSGVITLQTAAEDPWPADRLDATTGTELNRVGTDPAGTALGLQKENNGTLTIGFSSAGYDNLELSFAARDPGSSFDSLALSYEYSINGDDWMTIGDPVSPNINQYSIVTFDLSEVAALNNQASLFLRLTFTGANPNANTYLSIDNLQINGTGVPEAQSLAMAGVAVLLFGGVAYRRRRAAAGQSVPTPVLAA
jgi:hypothetical protein